MYVLRVKGRGYFNGVKSSLKFTTERAAISKHTECKMADMYNGILSHTTQYNYKVSCKRDMNTLGEEFTFKTKAKAKQYISDLKKKWANTKKNTKPIVKKRINYKHYYIYNYDECIKVLLKLEVIEDKGEYFLKKKTNRRINNKPLMIVTPPAESRGYDIYCDVCSVSISHEEPFIKIADMKICQNCLEPVAHDLKTKFKTMPNHKEVISAWELERITNAI